MHIGFVVYGSLEETSGGFRYDRRLVEYLRDRGDTVDVIALPWPDYWRAVVDGVGVADDSRLNRPVDVLLQDELCHPSLWRRNRRLTRPGAIVALVHHIDSDATCGRLPWLRRRIERAYLRSVDGAICTSAFTRRRAETLAPGLGEGPVAPPAGRIEGRGPSESAVRRRAEESPLRITFIGNLVPRKDPETMLAALSTLSTRHDLDWQATVVGSHEADPGYAASVRESAAERGVDDRVTFTGEVEDARLRAVLESSHVLCVPSRYEGFGMAYLEAMEYGVVPIASARGGAEEFVVDGDNGALVDPGDADRIAALLADWGTNRDRLAALGVAALDTAAAHPSWEETLGEVRSWLASIGETEPAAEPRRGLS